MHIQRLTTYHAVFSNQKWGAITPSQKSITQKSFLFSSFLNSFAGFDAVTLANNHINDFSAEGVNFTVETIKKAKIKHFGDSYGEWNSSQVIYDIYGAILLGKSIISSERLRAVNLEEVVKRWSWVCGWNLTCSLTLKKKMTINFMPYATPALHSTAFDCDKKITKITEHLTPFSACWTHILEQTPLIVEVKGTKIGFLGYCDTPSIHKNCTGMRKIFQAGAAVYTDDIAARDVRNLKKVNRKMMDAEVFFLSLKSTAIITETERNRCLNFTNFYIRRCLPSRSASTWHSRAGA